MLADGLKQLDNRQLLRTDRFTLSTGDAVACNAVAGCKSLVIGLLRKPGLILFFAKVGIIE